MNTCISIYSNISHNSQKLETTQLSIIRRINKQNWVIFMQGNYYSAIKRPQLLIHATRMIFKALG